MKNAQDAVDNRSQGIVNVSDRFHMRAKIYYVYVQLSPKEFFETWIRAHFFVQNCLENKIKELSAIDIYCYQLFNAHHHHFSDGKNNFSKKVVLLQAFAVHSVFPWRR